MKDSARSILKAWEKAKADRQNWDGLIDDALAHVSPHARKNAIKGASGGKEIFDSKAIDALNQRIATLVNDLFPPFDPMFRLSRDTDDQGFDRIETMIHGALQRSNFATVIVPVLRDVLISTGGMVIRKGTPDNPLFFEQIPIVDICPMEAADGRIRTNFTRFELTLDKIRAKWPAITIPDDIDTKKEDKDIEILEAILYDEDTERSRYHVVFVKSKVIGLSREYDTSPFVFGREDKYGAEVMGRGRFLQALPDIKTLNKAVELILKNASLAAIGIYQADDDGILDPSGIKIRPGMVLPKATGSKGLQPVTPGRTFDLTQIPVADLREQIKTMILGSDFMPPVSDSKQRTAFEWSQRSQQHQAVNNPMALRILHELYHGIGHRVLAILSDSSMARSPFYLEPKQIEGLRIDLNAPIVRRRQMDEARITMGNLVPIFELLGENVGQFLNIPGLIDWYLEKIDAPDNVRITHDDPAPEPPLVAAA